MGGYGSNASKWAMINSSGARRSHWGKVHAIQKSREARANNGGGGFSGGTLQSYTTHYQSRKAFKEGADKGCLHCGHGINKHTPVKKWCPLGGKFYG